VSVKVELKGGKEVSAALEVLVDSGRLVRREVLGSALAIQKEAKRRLRDDKTIHTGTLRNSIIAETDARGLAAEIGPVAPYGQYMEFGTGIFGPKHARLSQMPPGPALEDWARKHSALRTAGTSTEAITSTEQAGWAVARAIFNRGGLRPRPYLYPAFDNEEPKFIARLKKLYENLK